MFLSPRSLALIGTVGAALATIAPAQAQDAPVFSRCLAVAQNAPPTMQVAYVPPPTPSFSIIPAQATSGGHDDPLHRSLHVPDY
jgi:hypothetical protein